MIVAGGIEDTVLGSLLLDTTRLQKGVIKFFKQCIKILKIYMEQKLAQGVLIILIRLNTEYIATFVTNKDILEV